MTNLNLSEKSKNYYEENDIYEIFSIAEDYPNKIYKCMLPKIKGKIVLDLGCGTGKFMQKFYNEATKYYGLDLSSEQLNIAKKKINSNNVEFICCSAENIPLPDNSIDVIISTWVLGTILEVDRRNKVLDEMKQNNPSIIYDETVNEITDSEVLCSGDRFGYFVFSDEAENDISQYLL